VPKTPGNIAFSYNPRYGLDRDRSKKNWVTSWVTRQVELELPRLSLGVYPEVSLKQARERRETLRQQLADGIDPGSVRKAEKRAPAHTFKAVALEWHQQRVTTWSKGYGIQLMHHRMEKNLFPWIGSKPIGKLIAADFLHCLQRIEKRSAVEMAHRARGTCSDVMRFAVATRRAERDSTVDLKGAIAPTKRKHLASIKDPKGIGDLMRAIDGYVGRSEVVNAAVRLIPLVFFHANPRDAQGRMVGI
jgi:hypothetical protein